MNEAPPPLLPSAGLGVPTDVVATHLCGPGTR